MPTAPVGDHPAGPLQPAHGVVQCGQAANIVGGLRCWHIEIWQPVTTDLGVIWVSYAAIDVTVPTDEGPRFSFLGGTGKPQPQMLKVAFARDAVRDLDLDCICDTQEEWFDKGNPVVCIIATVSHDHHGAHRAHSSRSAIIAFPASSY